MRTPTATRYNARNVSVPDTGHHHEAVWSSGVIAVTVEVGMKIGD
jgi:hypothetical protein